MDVFDFGGDDDGVCWWWWWFDGRLERLKGGQRFLGSWGGGFMGLGLALGWGRETDSSAVDDLRRSQWHAERPTEFFDTLIFPRKSCFCRLP